MYINPNITNFEYSGRFDLTGLASSIGTPSINAGTAYVQITDTSTIVNTSGVKIAYTVTDPTGNVIYQGDFTSNYIAPGGILNIQIPNYGKTIAWGLYQIDAEIQDTDSTEYSYSPTKMATLCKPNAIKISPNTTNVNGGGICLTGNTDCTNKQLCLTDTTPYLYNNVAGTAPYNYNVQIITPPDPSSGNTSTVSAPFLPYCIPITLNGRYQIQVNNYVTYNFPNFISVTVGYSYLNDNYMVQCNIDPCQVLCEYDRLIEKYKKDCSDPNSGIENQQNLIIASGLLIKLLGFQSCGIDVGKTLKEVEELGMDCSKFCSPSAIIPSNIPTVGGAWSAFAICGDIKVQVNQSGNNVQLLLQDLSYNLSPAGDGTSDLMNIQYTINGCTKNFVISLQGLQNVLDGIQSALIMQGSAIGSLNGSLIGLITGQWTLLAPYYVHNTTDVAAGTQVGLISTTVAPDGKVKLEGCLKTTTALTPNATLKIASFPSPSLSPNSGQDIYIPIVICDGGMGTLGTPGWLIITGFGSSGLYIQNPSNSITIANPYFSIHGEYYIIP